MAKNAKVIARRDPNTGELESAEMLLRRFKKEVIRSCVLEDYKKHQFFMNPKELRQYKHDMLMRHLKNKKYKI